MRPSGLARCGHCVSHRSAWVPILRPESDKVSTLAMLSTQIVRAPMSFPKRIPKYPGAAPVEITT